MYLFGLVCWGTSRIDIWGHITTMPACSSGILTNVLPHRNAILQTRDMIPQPVTVYRHRSDLSLYYPLIWTVTLGYTQIYPVLCLGSDPTRKSFPDLPHLILLWEQSVRSSLDSVPYPPGPKLMTDTQHSTLNTPCIWLGISECRMRILPHFKIPHSNTWSWCWSFKCRVLRNCHKFRAWTQNLWWILRTLHSGFTLHTQDSLIQIHWVSSVKCWVSVISLGPGLQRNHYAIRSATAAHLLFI